MIPQCFQEFGLQVFCCEFLHLCSAKILVCSLIWFWYHDNIDFFQKVWWCFFLSCFMGSVEKCWHPFLFEGLIKPPSYVCFNFFHLFKVIFFYYSSPPEKNYATRSETIDDPYFHLARKSLLSPWVSSALSLHQTGFGIYIFSVPLKMLRNHICFLNEVVEILRKTTLELSPSDFVICRALLPNTRHTYILLWVPRDHSNLWRANPSLGSL